MRRTMWIAGVSLTAIALIGGGWFGARAFTSPEQWAAQASPPPELPILAEVTQGDLIDERTLAAALVPTTTATATLAAVDGATRSIVTASDLVAGANVMPGTVIVRVNGEPVFALTSPFPFYRDLGVGDSGPDVRVLQENLRTMGLLTGVDGDFGAGTADAVARLYREAGAAPPTRAATAAPANEGAAGDPATSESASQAADTVYFPLSAVATVAELPATLASVPTVGTDVVDGAEVSFAAATAVVRVSVPVDLAAVLVAGAELNCVIDDAPEIPCRVERVFDAPVDAEGAGSGDQVLTWADVAPTEGLISAQIDATAVVRVHVATLAEGALLVPVLAVAQQTESSGTVLRQEDGAFEAVEVRILGILDGTAAITGDVNPGDRLRVG